MYVVILANRPMHPATVPHVKAFIDTYSTELTSEIVDDATAFINVIKEIPENRLLNALSDLERIARFTKLTLFALTEKKGYEITEKGCAAHHTSRHPFNILKRRVQGVK